MMEIEVSLQDNSQQRMLPIDEEDSFCDENIDHLLENIG